VFRSESQANGSFASRIREAREKASLSQAELAAELGVTTRAVQTWETGTRTPRPRLLRALAVVTERPVAWFFEGEQAA
jgi:transcriptional regulator with XRE-family HTH domain